LGSAPETYFFSFEVDLDAVFATLALLCICGCRRVLEGRVEAGLGRGVGLVVDSLHALELFEGDGLIVGHVGEVVPLVVGVEAQSLLAGLSALGGKAEEASGNAIVDVEGGWVAHGEGIALEGRFQVDRSPEADHSHARDIGRVELCTPLLGILLGCVGINIRFEFISTETIVLVDGMSEKRRGCPSSSSKDSIVLLKVMEVFV